MLNMPKSASIHTCTEVAPVLSRPQGTAETFYSIPAPNINTLTYLLTVTAGARSNCHFSPSHVGSQALDVDRLVDVFLWQLFRWSTGRLLTHVFLFGWSLWFFSRMALEI